MGKTVEYYFAPQSPWTYLGHARLVSMVQVAGSSVEVLPVDLGRIFPLSGGLPLAKRAPQRQAYRLLELRRFADYLGLPLQVQPQFFPVVADQAARLITAVNLHAGATAALRLTGAILAAVWAQQRNIAEPATLAELLTESGLGPQWLDRSEDEAVQQRYQAATQRALDVGVFGAPTYRIAGEMFWGQDRLDFVARCLASA
ncbi:MAG: 2-hydroxychromene-2-carboxylate isomerase [Rhodoferax sp.]|nr:2-hydroxychromene-2-carboxylate isomerase [Rhodoferax sp.]